MRTFVLALVVALAPGAAPAFAQVPGLPTRPATPVRRPAPVRGDTIRARGDTIRARADSAAAKDTLAKANFAPPDSVMQRLMSTPGYTVTQYQGEAITFDALTRAIQLMNKAIVLRDSNLVKSDTITYSGSGSQVRVGTTPTGRSVFASPGQAPVVSRGAGSYDITNRRALVSNASTSVPQSGQTLFITGEKIAVVAGADSVKNPNDATYYLRDGTITACDDSIPDYYFRAKEIKRTGTFVVARPAILYIGDVPVMWLPFVFQDIRGGRHSGLIAPNIGVSDIVRNSNSYRRQVEGLGYYWAISDYVDAMSWLDWRSSAGDTQFGDLGGFTKLNGELRYRWLERYVSGNFAASKTSTEFGSNTAISWGHAQDFTRNSSLRMDLNYTSNDVVQRSTTVNPYAVLSTIRSSANYTQKIGPANVALGASRLQYPGRTQVDETFPTLSMSTSPISLGSWLVWTPNLQYTSHRATGVDQPSPTSLLVRTGRNSAGTADSIVTDTLRRNSYDSSLSFDTPLQIFGYNLGNRFTITSFRGDFPERQIVADVVTGIPQEKIYAATYRTEIDWSPNFTLPPLARNRFNLTPSVSLTNVDGSAFWIRNERTGGEWVHQSKRPTFSLSASPTLFGLYGGFGPFERIRHSIAPVISWSYAPKAELSDDWLRATGQTRGSYLGALRQNTLTLGLSTNFEAKARAKGDSAAGSGEKLKLLSVNFTSLSYNFEVARATHSAIRGLTTPNFGYTLTSDLLPGFNLGVDYSLFQGSTSTDTAKFSPFRERITGSFSFSNTANPFAVFARLFGRAVPPTQAATDQLQSNPDDPYARQVASQPVAGRSARSAAFMPNVTQGWQAALTFSSSRQRPVTGANVVAFDPAIQCAAFNTPTLVAIGAYDQCILRARSAPAVQTPVTSGLPGSTVYLVPNVTTLGSNLSLNVTEHWSASWQTTYDFENRSFASQIVSLQRDLHDWRAIFAFTQSPNGSFAFNFLISLKAEPDLKFDYHKSTYRNNGF